LPGLQAPDPGLQEKQFLEPGVWNLESLPSCVGLRPEGTRERPGASAEVANALRAAYYRSVRPLSDFIQIGSRGELSVEDEGLRSRLALRAGRYVLAPTSPDLLLGVRAPCTGEATAAPRTVLAGDLSGVSLADVVAFLNQSRVSGVLKVLNSSGERALVFKSGEVRSAASDDPADSVGEIAVRLGLVERPALERVLAMRPPAHRVGRLLVEAGHLEPHGLWRCLQHQVSEVFHALLLAQEGAFLLLDEEVDERGMPAINTQGLLLDSLRRIDEMKEYRKQLPTSQAYMVRKRAAGASLDAQQRALYDLCTGDRTLAEIARMARLSEFEATKALHALVEAGYLSAAASPQSAPAMIPAPSAEEVAGVFNSIFREILSEVRAVNMSKEFLAAATGALASQTAKFPFFARLAFFPDGSLPDEALFQNLAKLSLSPNERARTLHAALSELMFFLLFQTSELLDPRADEDLARRVKQLLAAIEGL
jgi:hypothetical protein